MDCQHTTTSAAEAQYCPVSSVTTLSPKGTPAAQVGGGTLPFTGLDVSTLLMIAIVLIVLGVALAKRKPLEER